MNKKLETMRHSCSHILATAVLKLFPKAKLAIGPAIEDGFYYDFDLPRPISEVDLEKITSTMIYIIGVKDEFKKQLVPIAKAKELFKDQPYKLELIEELAKQGNKQVSLYKSGDFVDLCQGPHVKDTSQIGSFKLLSIAGAYWRRDEKNKMLTRIYGTCFSTKKELDEYLEKQKLMEERDHRKLGKDLDLFVFSDLIGKGLPSLTPKGAVIRRELERFVVDEEIKRGYQHVYTAPLAKTELYKTSGHYPYFKETMYPVMKVEDEELILRPMTCPHHFMLYKSKLRSYRELPVRYAEIASQFRFEKSGELTGLTRVRTFCLADAHIICTRNQATEEIKKVLDLIDYANNILGFVKGKNYRYRLSLGDRQDNKKYFKDDKAWDSAENVLREVLDEIKAPYFEAQGEAAFYGPKIDIQMKRINGQEETAFTVQYDFVMPKRFKLEYIDEKGEPAEPIVIHRSSIGAVERTMSFLIEHYAGVFPVWLAPVQVIVIPISDKYLEYASSIIQIIKENGIRVELDNRNETMGTKIREATLQKVPFMVIIGEKEVKNQAISVRTRKGEIQREIKLKEFLAKVGEEIRSKSSTV